MNIMTVPTTAITIPWRLSDERRGSSTTVGDMSPSGACTVAISGTSAPQNRHRFAARLIVSAHTGHGLSSLTLRTAKPEPLRARHDVRLGPLRYCTLTTALAPTDA